MTTAVMPTTGQLFVLAIVSKHGPSVPGARVRELLQSIGMPCSRPSFYQLMSRLHDRGWIHSARDGDGSSYTATPAGERILDTFCTRLESVR